jgi:hypothetical protein
MKLVLKQLLVEWDLGQFQEIVFEIAQVPHHGLLVKCRLWDSRLSNQNLLRR